MPSKIDLIVGIPRSGLVAGNFLSLALNVPLTDMAGLLEGRLFEAGKTKKRPDFERALSPDRTVVVIDDTIDSGRAFREARERIEAAGVPGNFFFCAVYSGWSRHPDVDLVMEAVGRPNLCEWNIMHTDILSNACVDIDGVLCSNCPAADDDDGERYQAFLQSVPPLYRPTKEIAYLVTGRKKKYRAQTEDWLGRHGVQYRELLMLDDHHENGFHARHKAEVFSQLDAVLFIESELNQAEEIARLSGKPVISMQTQHLVTPELSYKSAVQSMRLIPNYLRNDYGSLGGLKLRIRRALGSTTYNSLKRIVRR